MGSWSLENKPFISTFILSKFDITSIIPWLWPKMSSACNRAMAFRSSRLVHRASLLTGYCLSVVVSNNSTQGACRLTDDYITQANIILRTWNSPANSDHQAKANGGKCDSHAGGYSCSRNGAIDSGWQAGQGDIVAMHCRRTADVVARSSPLHLLFAASNRTRRLAAPSGT